MNTWIFAITTSVVIISSSIGQNVGQGIGPWTGGKATATVLYKAKYYRDAVITDFHQTTVTIASRDGDGEIPVNSLPMAMKSEHAAWLKQNSSATSPAATPSHRAAPTGGGDVASWQRRAIATYPDLAKDGTPLHTRFLALVAERKEKEPTFFKTPSWPVILADQAAAALQTEAAAAAKQAATDAMWSNKHTLIEVKTDRLAFLDKPFSVTGAIEVSDSYYSRYYGAEGTHYAFDLRDDKESCIAYMERAKAQEMRKQLLDAGKSLNGTFLLVIPRQRYENGGVFVLEILDYRASPK